MQNKNQTQNSPSYLFGCGDENELSKLQQLSKIKDAKMACISSGERKKVFYLYERLPRSLEQQEEKDIEYYKKKYKNCTILQAIWDGRCTLYDGKAETQNASDNWLKNQSELYQVAYRSIENLDDDDIYQQKRTEYETALIAALQQCDQEGLFGNRAENGILLFAFYIDDYDENDEQSLLYRSATQLNQPDTYQKLIG